MSPCGIKRTSDDVRLMSAKRTKAVLIGNSHLWRPSSPFSFLNNCLLIRFHARRNLGARWI